MPRPVDEGLTGARSGGFGPPAQDSSNLGQIDVSTIHQLDVSGPGDSEAARQLIQTFSKGAAVAEKAIDRHAALQGDADQAAGEAAGSVGDVDQARMQAASRYAMGVKRAQAVLTVNQASEQAKTFADQHQTMSLHDTQDKDGNTVPGLLSSVDGIFRSAFPNGQEKDPVVANLIAPVVQHTHNEILGKYYQNQVIAGQQTAEAAQAAALHQSVMTGAFDKGGVMSGGATGLPFDVKHSLESLSMVYDPKTAREALVHAVGEEAVASGRPDLINSVLPQGVDFGGGATLTPENRAYLDMAKNRALESQERVGKIAAGAYASSTMDFVLKGGDPRAMLHTYLAMPFASYDTAIQISRFAYTHGKENESDALDSNPVLWKGLNEINLGHIDNIGQAVKLVNDAGLAGTKMGFQVLGKLKDEMSANEKINHNDPDYMTYRDDIYRSYEPKKGPMGNIMTPKALAQQAGAVSDYNTYWQQGINGGQSNRDAAIAAAQKVRDKYGDPVDSATPGTQKPNAAIPHTEGEKIAAVKGDLKTADGQRAFNAAGVTMNDVQSLTSAGAITMDQAELAARVIRDKHANHQVINGPVRTVLPDPTTLQ